MSLSEVQLDRAEAVASQPAARRNPTCRRVHAPGAHGQLAIVTGPRVPLPPFGRRAGDIKPLKRSQLALRRALDVVLACTAIVAAVPLMAVCAVGIRLTSRGPVLFKHERVGKDGRTFLVLKFRTMSEGTHGTVLNDEYLMYSLNNFKLDRNDPRISSIGRLLRRTSLDELPQLFNVLRGEMSIVGLRPIEPAEFATRPPVDQALYCRLRPGLTGLWQTSGRTTITLNQRVAIDRVYAADWNFGRDLRIIARTPAAVLQTSRTA